MRFAALVAASPWIGLPLVTLWRARGSRTLAEFPAGAPADAPRVAVIIPARNEARNIARCLRSVLSSRYPRLEVVVVDDRSDDDTGTIARAIAREDRRVTVLDAPPLPDGWFGKQWACTQGAAATDAPLLCFTDADTTHAPDLLPRAVNALRARAADLLSVVGSQELGSFWERVVQPQIFTLLLGRYGSTERVNRSARASEKIANGQYILVRRDAYDALGGHGSVREKVAEDLALAQRFFAQGRRAELVLGLGQLSTRMYTSLPELVGGWSKNVFAGAIDAAPLGLVGRAFLPVTLIAVPMMGLVPPLALAAALLGLTSPGVAVWAAVSTAALLLWWLLVYARGVRASPAYALVFPLGAAVLLFIFCRAIIRGRRVRWKGREYRAG